MSQPDAVPVSPSPDYAVLGLSTTDEVEAQWVTPDAANALAQVLTCERAGFRGVVLELDEDGAVPLAAREVAARALAEWPSGGARHIETGTRDPHTEAGRWLAGVLGTTAAPALELAPDSWDTAAAKWAAYFPNLPSPEARILAGLTDEAAWEKFCTGGAELIDLLLHMDTFGSDSSTSPAGGVRPLSYYVHGFQRLRAACDAVPELRQAAEFFLLQAVRSSREAAEVAGFVGAASEDMRAWAQDRFGDDAEVTAAAQERAALWRAGRQLSAADQRRAAEWQAQHPSARRERQLLDTWSAQRGPGGSVSSERHAAGHVERESTEVQRQARDALWAYLAEHEAELTAPDPVRRGPGRDQWLRHRREAERLALAAYVSVERGAADLERVLNRVGAALESGEEGFADFASEWRALQQASGAFRGVLPGDPSELARPGHGWGKWQRSVPRLYRLTVDRGELEDGVTSEPLAAALWWLRRDRPESRVTLSCSDALGQWQTLTIRLLLRRFRYAALSTQERAELDAALAVWLLEEGESSGDRTDWHHMGQRWAEVLSDAPPRVSVLTRVRALGHGKPQDVAALQQGASLPGDGEGGLSHPGESASVDGGTTAFPDRPSGVSQTVLLESSQAGDACYLHAALRKSGRTVVAAIRPSREGVILADSNTVDTSRLFAALVEQVSGSPEAQRTQVERQVIADEIAAFAVRAGRAEQAPWVSYLRDIEDEYMSGQATLAQYIEAAEQAWHQLVQLISRGQQSDGHGALDRWYEVGSPADPSGPGEVHLDLAGALCAWAQRDRPDERFVIVTGEIAIPGRRVLHLPDVPVADLIGPGQQVSGACGSQVVAALASWVHQQARSTALGALEGKDSIAWMRAGWAWGLVFGALMPERVADELKDLGLPGETVQAAAQTVATAVAQLQLEPSAADSRSGWLLLTAAAATWDEAVGPSRAYLDRLLPADLIASAADDSERRNPFLTAACRIGFIAQHSGAPALGAAYRAAARFGRGATDLTGLTAMPSRTLARAIEVQRRTPREADRAFRAAEALSQAAALLTLYVDQGYPEHAIADLRQSVREARGYLSAVCRQQAAGLVADRDPLESVSTGASPATGEDGNDSAGE
ncbi:hypothetical protein [Streptomyces sp. S1D4-20]|uniref:hypothetical protein n=1 Tax=Streptomyces sp. S1D4-20 TaxID=2594462 RepID=UPI0011646234|nr:hypothetical protein [Streptomyces sp. S1D4-20]QDN54192.1 hypothetical protein FNV67_01070 [Streptomyces sp. S1D4-20]